MRLAALLLTAILVPATGVAQEPGASSAPATSSTAPDAEKPTASSDLPVSLPRIREALEQPTPKGTLLKGLREQPNFRIEVQERLKIEELLSTLDFKAGPTPPGGVYAYEQQRLAFPAVNNPLTQPYSQFSGGELLTILVENLAGHYLGGRAIESVTKAMRQRAEAQARRVVDEAIAEYCADKPNNGVGIELCDLPPSTH